MNEHPIQGMAESILENINQMVDVNTIANRYGPARLFSFYAK